MWNKWTKTLLILLVCIGAYMCLRHIMTDNIKAEVSNLSALASLISLFFGLVVFFTVDTFATRISYYRGCAIERENLKNIQLELLEDLRLSISNKTARDKYLNQILKSINVIEKCDKSLSKDEAWLANKKMLDNNITKTDLNRTLISLIKLADEGHKYGIQ